MTKIARSQSGDGSAVHFVLQDDPDWAIDDRPFTLFVSTQHYSPERKCIDEEHFVSLEEARLYCESKHNLPANTPWEDDPVHTATFSFTYKVTHSGIPQPYICDLPDGIISISRGNEKVSIDDREVPGITICGNKEGLRRLAAMLLLCADSEPFDPMFHMHLEDRPGVVAELPVTLRAPGYLQWLLPSGRREG